MLEFRNERDWETEAQKCTTPEELRQLKIDLFSAMEKLLSVDMSVVMPLVMEEMKIELIGMSFEPGVRAMSRGVEKKIFELYEIEVHVPETDIKMLMKQIMGYCGQN